MAKKVECRVCVRDRTSDIDGLCDHCRSAQLVGETHINLLKFMTDEQIDALVAFLDAKAENERLS